MQNTSQKCFCCINADTNFTWLSNCRRESSVAAKVATSKQSFIWWVSHVTISSTGEACRSSRLLCRWGDVLIKLTIVKRPHWGRPCLLCWIEKKNCLVLLKWLWLIWSCSKWLKGFWDFRRHTWACSSAFWHNHRLSPIRSSHLSSAVHCVKSTTQKKDRHFKLLHQILDSCCTMNCNKNYPLGFYLVPVTPSIVFISSFVLLFTTHWPGFVGSQLQWRICACHAHVRAS